MSTLGFDITINGVSSAEECDKISGAGSAVREINNNVGYRSTLPKVHAKFAPLVEAETKIKRLVEVRTSATQKNADGTPATTSIFGETVKVYFNKVVATLVTEGKYPNEDAVYAHFHPVIQKCSDEVAFDASEREPAQPRARRMPKDIEALVTQYVADGKGAKLAAKLSKLLGRPVEPTVESLGWAVHEDSQNELQKVKAAQAARFAAL